MSGVKMATDGSMKGSSRNRSSGKDTSSLVAVPDILCNTKVHLTTPTTPSPTVLPASDFRPNSKAIPILTPSPDASRSEAIAKPGHEPPSEQRNGVYDVYATPFVPSILRAINEYEPENTITTTNRNYIHYQRYMMTFRGTSFLPTRHFDGHDYYCRAELPLEELTVASYKKYFTTLCRVEYAAKEQENERHALYRVPLQLRLTSEQGFLWKLSVPGLREDKPFVQMGDTLQLRQLWVDGTGNIMHVEHSATSPVWHHYRIWTGVCYEASVRSVERAHEVVYLKAEGLTQLHAGKYMVPMMVNVVFPSKHRVLHARHNALLCIDTELQKLSLHRCGLSDDAHDGVGELEEPYKLKDTAKEMRAEDIPPSRNDWIRRMLFPKDQDGLLQTHLRKIPHRALFDHAVNFEQAHAVNSVCANDYSTLPYLISGPPGTGKTKTLVETVMQLLHTTGIAHILVCAPSEAAADTVALRLKQYLSTKQLLRLNRPGRADNEVPSELTQYCYLEDDMFYLPPFQQLMAYNVVVSSCQDAAILAEARLTNMDLWEIERNMLSAFHPEEPTPTPALHWGALLIDEAAQATEIDVLPAISVVCPPSPYPTNRFQPRFVMAGDENQLGPRTASLDPRYSTSLFARLFDRPLYSSHPLSRSHITTSSGPPVLKKNMLPLLYPPFANLLRNYRSHPAILSVPSTLFYNDTLIPEAPTHDTPLHHSSLWRGRRWPVLFVPHTGADEIERDAGGWYNVSEAHVACRIAQQLTHESGVKQRDICIMSPFAAQVRLLRSFMRSDTYGRCWDVNIGPLEAFQGLEKRVVIICSTRTRDRFLDDDVKRGVGIVHQKRKMNVALTRAMEGLVVIGNPEVLGKDKNWREWMAFCIRNGLVTGEVTGGIKPEVGTTIEGEPGNWTEGQGKLGVLERALVAREENTNKNVKMLGVGTAGLDIGGEYEAWVEGLREALDEEEDSEADEEDVEVEVED